jgi:hypothetical protein
VGVPRSALAETWRRRDGHVLTVEGYRASGGIRGAVARSADRLYDSLPTGTAHDGVLGAAAPPHDVTMATLVGARGEVSTLQFSRDGSVLLATSLDQTVSMYDVEGGTRIGDPIPHAAPFIYPGFLHPDGHTVVVTVREGVAIWDVAPDRLAAACELAGRNLTGTEWATHLGELGDRRATCSAFPPDRSDPRATPVAALDRRPGARRRRSRPVLAARRGSGAAPGC